MSTPRATQMRMRFSDDAKLGRDGAIKRFQIRSCRLPADCRLHTRGTGTGLVSCRGMGFKMLMSGWPHSSSTIVAQTATHLSWVQALGRPLGLEMSFETPSCAWPNR
jgi:hypothetical protein